MTRVEEIVAALKGKPTPMFLLGIAALGAKDFEAISSDIDAAGERIYNEEEREGKKNAR